VEPGTSAKPWWESEARRSEADMPSADKEPDAEMAPADDETPTLPRPVAAPPVPRTATVAVEAPAEVPVVRPAAPRITAEPIVVPVFALPIAELAAVASGAGLEWVNSDSDKVRAVQLAMAEAPKPIRVPREPKPVAVIDDGPLVLVETRKDLSQIKLPFEGR
jgi:ribonuclease E